MSRQAIVGAFTLLGFIALFAVYFTLSNFAARVNGYNIGVRFDDAGGLTVGAAVYESGVQVGTVSKIQLQPDYSVDVIMTIFHKYNIPLASKFTLSAPLTGGSSIYVTAPKQAGNVAILPHYVIMPVSAQPHGENPPSLSDVLSEGQPALAKMNDLLADLSKREPKLLDHLQAAIDNANSLAMTANGALREFADRGNTLLASMQTSLKAASGNIVDLTGQLDDTMKRNGGRVDTLLTSLNSTASSLSAATASMAKLANNPQLRDDILKTTAQIAITMTNMSALSADLRHAAEDPATQGQLKDTLAHIDAVSQRASSLLGQLGGTSSVYGVDAGATPPPASAGEPIVPGSPAPAVPSPAPLEQKKEGVTLSPAVRGRIGALAQSLFEVQVRLSELSTKAAGAADNALLGSGRGPQSDFNVVVLPHGNQQLYAGVNDLSANQTWNLAMREQVAPGVLLGGGILYSRLGVMGQISKGVFGFEGLAYDPRYGYVDGYLRLHATSNLDVVAGERDIFHDSRRTTYGLQYRLFGGT